MPDQREKRKAESPTGAVDTTGMAKHVVDEVETLVRTETKAAKEDVASDVRALEGPAIALASAGLLALGAFELLVIGLAARRRRSRWMVGAAALVSGAAGLTVLGWLTLPRRLHVADAGARVGRDLAAAKEAIEGGGSGRT